MANKTSNKKLVSSRKWKLANKTRVAEYKRRKRLENPLLTQQIDRQYNLVAYQRNPSKKRALTAEWKRQNPSKVNAQKRRRVARKRNAPGNGVSGVEWESILLESMGLCAYCGNIGAMTMDHIDPIALGGSHDITNIAAACRSCNSSKGDTPLLQWLIQRKETI